MTKSIREGATPRRVGRPATGNAEWRGGRWHTRVRFVDGSRPWVPLDPSLGPEDVEAARACAVEVAELARGERMVTAKETLREFANRWHDWREERGLACVKDDRARLENHVFGFRNLGDQDVTRVTRAVLEDLVEHLDTRVRAGELGWKVASLAWSNVSRLFDDAQSAKRRDLRVRSDNPAFGVRAPDVGVKKLKQYLFPDEVRALIACPRVPLRWRVLFAVAVYTYARSGELRALQWSDVDLEHGRIDFHEAIADGKRKETKTKVARRVPIEPALLPLLAALREQAGGVGPVLDVPSEGMLSARLREYLERAGVTREALFTSLPTRKRITFHDLRATGITWCAIRGDAPLQIRQRAGHEGFGTTEGYIREAENLRAGFGEPFPPLPDGLAGLCPTNSAREALLLPRKAILPGTSNQWAQQDLNL